MGNNNVYGQGHFLTPNKIQKPKVIDKDALNIQNIFGKIDMNSARAQKGQQTVIEVIQNSYLTKIEYYERQIIEQKIIIKERNPSQYALTQKKITNSQIQIPEIEQRKVKSQVQNSMLTRQKQTYDMEKFTTRKDSPIKNQTISSNDSKVRIFESRLQNKYFKLNK